MRAAIAGSGIYLNFDEGDKLILEFGGTLEGRFDDYLKPSIKVHIDDVVERDEKDILPQDGFKVKALPRGPPRQKTSYEIWLCKEYAKHLISKGYWGTRCSIDRVEMVYWDFNANRT